MDEDIEAQFLTTLGRISTLEVAVRQLIENSPEPAAVRLAIWETIESAAKTMDSTGNERHGLVAGGMRMQAESLLST